ncbi:hypothetical protein LSTR_LSTR008130 [Laodelphax striatellus]|uniref:Uncharacterized protein n=1 Tax=Laodelphax striatellus TaxID=195883 RepID=A0A482XW70_LAOST|nr:hypothetical protein LSTR_LSTR008130 [Laodelphax striatellus]
MLTTLFGVFYDSRPAYKTLLLNMADVNRDEKLGDEEFMDFYEAAIEFYAATIEDEHGERKVEELDLLSRREPCKALSKKKVDFSEYYLIKTYRRLLSDNFELPIFTKLPEDVPKDWPKC